MMGIRFRKSFKVAPGIRFTLSNSGASIRAGTRHAGITKSSRGTRVGASLPGTGLSVNEKLGKKTRSKTSGSLALVVFVVLAVVIAVAVLA